LCWNNEGESGSTFVVRLPAATETSLAAAVKRRPMSATTVPRTATAILVIEDEPSVSAFVRRRLSGEDIRWCRRLRGGGFAADGRTNIRRSDFGHPDARKH